MKEEKERHLPHSEPVKEGQKGLFLAEKNSQGGGEGRKAFPLAEKKNKQGSLPSPGEGDYSTTTEWKLKVVFPIRSGLSSRQWEGSPRQET